MYWNIKLLTSIQFYNKPVALNTLSSFKFQIVSHLCKGFIWDYIINLLGNTNLLRDRIRKTKMNGEYSKTADVP